MSTTTETGYALLTGGAGFVGSNLADRLLRDGHRVVVLDDLSRQHVERNVRWLRERHGDRVTLHVGDVRDPELVIALVHGADQIFHFAAQVAVTTSIDEPMADFGVNAAGTINLLEAVRLRRDPPPLVFTSTNKVYGALSDVQLRRYGDRYEPADATTRAHGIPEQRPLDFHSPYGCSKGAADQYVLDYGRTYGLPTCVFRMSCVYGPRQFGTEDQGWVAHFLIRALDGAPITIYGDGAQVRDVLFVDDLVEAFLAARDGIDTCGGRAFNIGGGPGSTLSLLELIDRIDHLTGTRPEVVFDDWRVGDQRYYCSDTTAFCEATGWRRRVAVDEGLRRLHEWLQASREERDGSALRSALSAVAGK